VFVFGVVGVVVEPNGWNGTVGAVTVAPNENGLFGEG
jgi:hypothetical protein